MRSKLAMLCLLLSVSCGKADDSSSTISALPNSLPSSHLDRTLDRVTFVTAHNAFASNIKSIVPNQSWSIKEQLNNGVRGFMLDIWSQDKKAVLCHMTCDLKIGSLKIKSISVSLTDQFKVFEEFLKANPNEIITLHLEWTPSAKANEFRDAINKFPTLKSMIFDPYKSDVKTNGWPKIREMISSNKRLLILSQTDATRDIGVGYDRDFTVENYWSMGVTGSDRSCKSRWDDIPLDRDNTQVNKFRRLFVMNHFRDAPSYLTSVVDNADLSLWNRISEECVQASRRAPNYVAVDFVNTFVPNENDIAPPPSVFGTVATLNKVVGVGFENPGWGGKPQFIIKDETMDGSDGKLKNDTLSSIEIFIEGTKLALFDNSNYTGFLGDITASTGNLEGNNDKVSAWRVGR